MAGQYQIVEQDEPTPNQGLGKIALFDADGNPVTLGGGGGEAPEVGWDDVTGKPSTFTPAAHTHEISDVTGLEAALTSITGRLDALEAAAGGTE